MDKNFNGVIDAVSPFPATQFQLVTAPAHIVKGRNYLSFYAPASFIRFFMGERGLELLKSNRGSAEKLLQTGFEFSFPAIGSALEDLYGKK